MTHVVWCYGNEVHEVPRECAAGREQRKAGEVAGVAVCVCSAQRIPAQPTPPCAFLVKTTPLFHKRAALLLLLLLSPPFAPSPLHRLSHSLTFLHLFAKVPRLLCRYLATMDTQLAECLSLIATERASSVRNWNRYRNLRHMLRNIREDLRQPKTWPFDNRKLRLW